MDYRSRQEAQLERSLLRIFSLVPMLALDIEANLEYHPPRGLFRRVIHTLVTSGRVIQEGRGRGTTYRLARAPDGE
jgi:hypothetical protein